MRTIIKYILVVVAMNLPGIVAACPSCYGAGDGPMRDGVNAAIFGMLGFIGLIFTGVIAFAIMMYRRSRRASEKKSDNTFITSSGNIQWKNS